METTRQTFSKSAMLSQVQDTEMNPPVSGSKRRSTNASTRQGMMPAIESRELLTCEETGVEGEGDSSALNLTTSTCWASCLGAAALALESATTGRRISVEGATLTARSRLWSATAASGVRTASTVVGAVSAAGARSWSSLLDVDGLAPDGVRVFGNRSSICRWILKLYQGALLDWISRASTLSDTNKLTFGRETS